MKLILALAVPLVSLVLPLVDGKPIHNNRDSGPVKANLSRRFNFVADGKTTLPQIDRARAAALRDRSAALKAGSKRDDEQPVNNVAVVYTASIGVGEPATEYSLLIDTGSSNTWIGAGKSYVRTSTSSDTGATVSVSYGSGYFSGEEYKDKVTITDSLVIDQQSIGVADESEGLDGYDGILGIGPTVLTIGTLSTEQSVPTVTDNLYNTSQISHNAIGVFYAPFTVDNVDGVLSWGGADSSLYEGSLTYVPITSTYPSEYYWGIDQRISYGTSSILTSSGIVDTGTTLILIASDAFAKYKAATGAVEDGATGLLKITAARYASLKGLNFVVGGTTFTLPPNGQIWPRELNVAIGGQQDAIYLIVADLGSQSGEGLDFINGYTFLERFYSVYDTENGRVGLANTKYTNATTN